MIDIALVTWPNHPLRFDYFADTVQALKDKLTASGHELRFIASAEAKADPDSRWMGQELAEYCAIAGVELHWRKAKPNLGANMNAALRLCSAEVIFLVQDDWILLHPLDLSPGAEFMLAHREIDLMRYSYPDVDRMRPTFHSRPDGWRDIDPGSAWFYGDDPHLRRPDFMDKWGWYLEGSYHSSASQALMSKLKAGNAKICAADKCYFQHHGKISSYPNEIRPGRKR